MVIALRVEKIAVLFSEHEIAIEEGTSFRDSGNHEVDFLAWSCDGAYREDQKVQPPNSRNVTTVLSTSCAWLLQESSLNHDEDVILLYGNKLMLRKDPRAPNS